MSYTSSQMKALSQTNGNVCVWITFAGLKFLIIITYI